VNRLSRQQRFALQLAVVAGVYYGSGKLGLDLAFATSSVTAIWPPTGIALSALILGGYRLWPAVTIGALLTNIDTGVPAGTVLGITLGNTLEALAGAYLLRRVADFRPRLDRVRDVLALAGLGAGVSTIASATIGVTSLLAGGAISGGDIPSVWRTWWLGDMGGDLIVAPALLVAATHWPYRRAPGRALEAAVLAAGLAGVSFAVFSQRTTLVYVVFPFLIWAALRFWQPGAAAGSLLVASIAVPFAAHGKGPFAMSSPDDRLLLAQTLVSVAGTTALVLAAVTSERRRAEDAAHEIAATLQESLLPASLPVLPRLEAAAYFRPAGEGHRVGGDFYDVFQAGDGHWAVTIGDVSGKGPRAAAVTALARYTLRAAAVHESSPAGVLAALNDAIARQYEGSELCTAIYARLDVDDGPARLTVSSGGHPLPLLVRADGRVETVGVPGRLLGADPEALLGERSAELGAGDTVLFYTDGLTDADAPRRVVAVPELEAVLRRCAARRPRDVIAALEQSLLPTGGREPRDDVALVVLRVSTNSA